MLRIMTCWVSFFGKSTEKRIPQSQAFSSKMLFLFVLVFIFIALLVVYARWTYGTLEKMGIPVIEKPFLIFGNMFDAFSKCYSLKDIENFKKAGPIYGVYEGREPQIHVCDAELIRLITTKDAEYFHARRPAESVFRDPILNNMPDFLAPYDKWKTVRGFLTPQLSLAKIKRMSDSMNDTVYEFCKRLKDQLESSPGHKVIKYDLRDACFTMITDLVARSFFSIKVENPSDPNNALVSIVRDLTGSAGRTSVDNALEILGYAFPFIQRFLPGPFDGKKAKIFRDIFMQMMDDRRKSGIQKKDVVDMCIEQLDKLSTEKYKQQDITENTIICQAFVFFFAGNDQISNISSFLAYFILKNPDAEKRVYDELDAFLEKHNGHIGLDNVGELQYLRASVEETLRFYPFFSRLERVCTKDWENEEFGLKIKKGTVIQIPIWAANRNPKYFEDPEKFNPERFLPENKEKLHPYALHSFGHGPRNCIGMRFSIDTLMLFNAHVLKNFKFHLRHDSEPTFLPVGPLLSPQAPFFFDVTLRSK